MKRTKTGEIDWAAIRRDLAEVASAIREQAPLSPELGKQLLDRRAALLAQPPSAPPLASEVLELITFRLSDEQYCLETRSVREVLRAAEVTPVPGTPEFLRGVTNLRGELLAVFDVSRWLGVKAGGQREQPWVLVLGRGRNEFGISVDAVGEVTSLRIDDVLSPQASSERVDNGWLRGVTPTGLSVLDGTALLADPRIRVDEG